MRELRLARKLKQEEVSRQIGIARTTYAMYEQNNRQPDHGTLIKLAEFFGVTVDRLIGRASDYGFGEGKLIKDSNGSYHLTGAPPVPEGMSEEEYARRAAAANEIFALPAEKLGYIEAILEAIRKEMKKERE